MITLIISLDHNEALFKALHDAAAHELRRLDGYKQHGGIGRRDEESLAELEKLVGQFEAEVAAWVKRRRQESEDFQDHNARGA